MPKIKCKKFSPVSNGRADGDLSDHNIESERCIMTDCIVEDCPLCKRKLDVTKICVNIRKGIMMIIYDNKM